MHMFKYLLNDVIETALTTSSGDSFHISTTLGEKVVTRVSIKS